MKASLIRIGFNNSLRWTLRTRRTSKQWNPLASSGCSAKRWKLCYFHPSSSQMWLLSCEGFHTDQSVCSYFWEEPLLSLNQVWAKSVWQVNNDGSCTDGHSLTCIPPNVSRLFGKLSSVIWPNSGCQWDDVTGVDSRINSADQRHSPSSWHRRWAGRNNF